MDVHASVCVHGQTECIKLLKNTQKKRKIHIPDLNFDKRIIGGRLKNKQQ